MGGQARVRRTQLVWSAGAVLLAASALLVARELDVAVLLATLREAINRPAALAGALVAYAAAFAVRAALWRRVLPALSLSHALAALHVSLAGNHVLPLRLGEALRVTSVVRRTSVLLPEATASTLTLRAADLFAVVALAAVLGPRLLAPMAGAWAWAAAAAVTVVGAAGLIWLRRLARAGDADVRIPALTILIGSTLAWILESAVVWFAVSAAGIPISPLDAVLVTAVTIAAQALAITPGGVGTYEAAATSALVALGADAGTALAAALAAHAVKTMYALAAGAIAAVTPAPSLLGHVRLRAVAPQHDARAASADAPVVLFMPAHNEAQTVADVVGRAPAQVAGRRVEVVVVDDGSTDATAELAAEAGAHVVRITPNRGLGAAVRTGLRKGVERGAAAVVFCDADGEYAPEELGNLVRPILAGEADYVIGSRFSGDIRRMLPHRRLGNRVLTLGLRFVSRAPITDGQSGYRALSPAAAADAEVIHDFNYAQVLTLDLLGKGYRYAEVPISYGFREHGDSFIRLGRYLRAVIPAVHREINRAA